VTTISVRSLSSGTAQGEPIVLNAPLSFWGGFDVATGRIIDRSHSANGEVLTGRIVIMPVGRGSSSGSSILAEAIRRGTAPSALILPEPDPILTVGAIVAQKLYGRTIPIVVCRQSIPAGLLRIDAGLSDGTIRIGESKNDRADDE
jgi:predicted aconitase with swiveling domain